MTTFETAMEEAREIAAEKGVHYAAATVHNMHSGQLGDIYERVSKKLAEEGYGQEFGADSYRPRDAQGR